MSESIWKLGETFRGPEDLDELWIDMGAEALYEIPGGRTVYARHRLVEFFIGPGNTEAERAALLELAQTTASHDVTLVIPLDEAAWDAVDLASNWVDNRTPEYARVPVLDIKGEPFGELRMNSIDGTVCGTALGARAQVPSLAGAMEVGEFMTCHLVNEKRQRLVFEIVGKYRKAVGGLRVQRVVADGEERPEPEILKVRPNELVYQADPRGLTAE